MAENKYYAWSELRLGGESTIHESATGVRRRIIDSRNVIMPGEEVTKADFKKFGATDDDWEAFIAGGSIRDYPMPEMGEGSLQSPNDFVLEKLRTGDREDLDPNTLMALAMGASGPIVPAHLDTTGENVKEVTK
jgi:hypothetical protein